MNPADDYSISTEVARLDIPLIHDFLRNSYWARDIPLSLVERSIRNSLCFGAFKGKRQAGFARVISDYATFAYIADVFVLPEHRGHGVSKLMMSAIRAHPDLQGLRRLVLATQDAHGLYAQFGFLPLSHPEYFMIIHYPNIYSEA
ncbi:MAG: GNAT family N-acetyltransferase [Prosthecobacter sp.]|nr:GNAT family N-acetyltransferase [Prosthecobacter sp.]